MLLSVPGGYVADKTQIASITVALTRAVFELVFLDLQIGWAHVQRGHGEQSVSMKVMHHASKLDHPVQVADLQVLKPEDVDGLMRKLIQEASEKPSQSDSLALTYSEVDASVQLQADRCSRLEDRRNHVYVKKQVPVLRKLVSSTCGWDVFLSCRETAVDLGS